MKKIYLLIWPKWAWKSFIGWILEKDFFIHFFSVEDIWIELKNTKNYTSEDEYFKDMENFSKEWDAQVIWKIKELLELYDEISIESLWIWWRFNAFLLELEKIARVITIRIKTDPEICLTNILHRDQSCQIYISLEKIRDLNNLSFNSQMNADYTLTNNNAEISDIKLQLGNIIK